MSVIVTNVVQKLGANTLGIMTTGTEKTSALSAIGPKVPELNSAEFVITNINHGARLDQKTLTGRVVRLKLMAMFMCGLRGLVVVRGKHIKQSIT